MSARPDIADAVVVFRQFLSNAGRTADELTFDTALEVFGQFAAQRFDSAPVPDSDGLLYQYGVHGFTGQDMFHLDLTRQFELVDDADEHQGLVQFHCTLLYPPDPGLRALGRHSQWWFHDGGDRPLQEWLRSLAARPEQALLRSRIPSAVEIGSEEI